MYLVQPQAPGTMDIGQNYPDQHFVSMQYDHPPPMVEVVSTRVSQTPV